MKFWSSVIASSLVIPAAGYAVGLGPIQVQSGLNQPFDAKISLLSLRNVPSNGIRVQLAGAQEFQQAGIPRPHYLDQLKFVVEKSKQGKPVIHITSIERMSEPFLKFLIDVAWSEGQIYREYTVLLDPPNYRVSTNLAPKAKPKKALTQPVAQKTEDKPAVQATVGPAKPEMKSEVAPVTKSEMKSEAMPAVQPAQKPEMQSELQAPVTKHETKSALQTPAEKPDMKSEVKPAENISTAPKPEMKPEVKPSTTVDLAPTAAPAAPVKDPKANEPQARLKANQRIETTYERTKSTDDLYQIAVKFRPFESVSVSQTMVAIRNMNPNAFIRGNVNGLKAGVKLSIPSVEMIAAIPKAQALAMVAQDNQQWFKNGKMPPTISVAQTKPAAEKPAAPVKITQAAPHVSHQDMIAQLLMGPEDLALNLEQSVFLKPESESVVHEANTLEKTLRTELAVTAEANTVMKQANVDLQQQLHDLQQKNEELIRVLGAREKEMNDLRQTIALNTKHETITTVPAVAPQTYEVPEAESTNRLMMLFFLLISASSAGLFFWFRHHRQAEVLWLKPGYEDDLLEVEDYDEEGIEALSGEDLMGSKLDLATAYIEMDDHAAAKELLEEVITNGNADQRTEAKKLLKKIA